MVLVDAWLVIESIVGFHTIVTMTFSLASVIKFVALFPVNGDVRSNLRKMGGSRTDVLTLNGESFYMANILLNRTTKKLE